MNKTVKLAQFDDIMIPADKKVNGGRRESYPVGLIIAAQIVLTNWSENFVPAREGSNSTSERIMDLLSEADPDDEDFMKALALYSDNKTINVYNSFAERYSKDKKTLNLHSFEQLYPTEKVYSLVGAFVTTLSNFRHTQLVENSRYWGEAGDKIRGLEVTLLTSKYFSTDRANYGSRGYTIYTFADDEGHVFVWISSVGPNMRSGSKYMFSSGTVKEHSRFRGIHQTKITRVKLLQFKNDEYIEVN